MAYLNHQIGAQQFISLRGVPKIPAMTVAIDSRPGVDGSEIMLTGKKGAPFTLVSQVDTATYADATAKLNEYLQMIAEAACELVIGGVSSYDYGYAVKVLNVEALHIAAITTPVGKRLNENARGWCECRWELIGILLE